MNDSKRPTAGLKDFLLSGKVFAVVMMGLGLVFIAAGIHRFWVRPRHFTVLSVLGCGVGAVGSFFLLLIGDYVRQHARLALIPWALLLLVLAATEPAFAVGLGVAIGIMSASQLRAPSA